MKKTLLTIIPLFLIVIGVFVFKNQSREILPTGVDMLQNTPTPNTVESSTFSPFTARFEIYTNGTKRIFTASMYHNLSNEVYISSPDPSLIHIQKPGVVWSDLFETLPMKLTKECLVTGTGQQFCASKTQSLLFYINDNIDKNALDKEIRPNDFLKVVYE